MNILTKVFVGLLVILSLLLSAASITFLYTVPDFNTKISNLETALASAEARAQRIAASELATRTAAEQRAAQLQDLLNDANAAVAGFRTDLGRAQAEKVSLESQIQQANQTQAMLSQAVNANMALVDTLRNEAAALREQYQRTLDQNLDLSQALARLTNEHDFLQRAHRRALEENKELLDQVSDARAMLTNLGVDFDKREATDLAPPPINGVIVQRMAIDGQPFALISVGSEDDVKKGMRFTVVDTETNQFLGFFTVEEVDDQVSIGKLTGPKVEQIAPNDAVRTQV